MHKAAFEGREEVIKALLASKADVHARDKVERERAGGRGGERARERESGRVRERERKK